MDEGAYKACTLIISPASCMTILDAQHLHPDLAAVWPQLEAAQDYHSAGPSQFFKTLDTCQHCVPGGEEEGREINPLPTPYLALLSTQLPFSGLILFQINRKNGACLEHSQYTLLFI